MGVRGQVFVELEYGSDPVQHAELDCYGTLIDWETGIAAVLGPWARRFDGSARDEDLLVASADHEAAVEAEQPAMLYPDGLRAAFRRTGAALGHEVTGADADTLGLQTESLEFPGTRRTCRTDRRHRPPVARRTISVPRPRAGPGRRAAHGLDQPPARPARLGRDTRPAGHGHA